MAGSRMAASRAMMPITTSSSTSVKADFPNVRIFFMVFLLSEVTRRARRGVGAGCGEGQKAALVLSMSSIVPFRPSGPHDQSRYWLLAIKS